MPNPMEKNFDPKQYEKTLYQMWNDQGCFHDEPDATKEPFTVVIPPPNITSQLHIGHALVNTLQDILVRYKRMDGYCTLWLPGTDHASIATEVKIIDALKQEGITKHDLGRDGFLERAWKWYETYGGRIVEQLKQMGCSCDWERLRFTLDDGLSNAVREVFVRLYERGLIYRGKRMINWCPNCKTALSNAEVEYDEGREAHLWYMRYPLTDGSGSIMVATTRPETMLGDTAVAVNPKDERYAHMVGKTCLLPIMNREIPIVADDYVEYEFGTGAVKITPAHDPNDYEVAMRHSLEIIELLNPDGTFNENAGKYCGRKASEAREDILQEVRALGLLEKIDPYTHNVGVCYRCHTDVEPLISEQWFVKMDPMTEPAVRVVEEGRIRFVPERFEKTYLDWMAGMRDWCISRQLWWGHRIPAWYCEDCGETVVSREDPTVCPKCGGTHLQQDPDVLDTWFSSALWPFSTMGWPENTADLSYFYPTSVLVTGYDIIGFWVSRMIFSGLEHMGDIPFHTVVINGLVRDELGRKMSKSLGNGVDPLEVIDRYGADALRFSLVQGTSAGNDMRFRWQKVEACRNFTNKIWNAARFLQMNIGEDVVEEDISRVQLDYADRWMLTQLHAITAEITGNLDHYDLGMAAQNLYDFVWSTYCDWYIELCKSRLNGSDAQGRKAALCVLLYGMRTLLKLLHPFMPYVTEAIWQHLGGGEAILMRAAWPKAADIPQYPQESRAMEQIIEMIRAIRNIRAEYKVNYATKTNLVAALLDRSNEALLQQCANYLRTLAAVEEITITAANADAPAGAVSAVCAAGTVYLPLRQLVDVEQELARLQKELAATQKEIAGCESRLANQSFLARAPQNVVEAQQAQLAAAQERLQLLTQRQRDMQALKG